MRRLCAKAASVCSLFFILLVLTIAGSGCEASGFIREEALLPSDSSESGESDRSAGLSGESALSAGESEKGLSGDSGNVLEKSMEAVDDKKTDSGLASKSKSPDICIHVCGCVKKPGLYYLPSGSRVADAVESAGGFSTKADRNAWNLAAPLEDGTQIYVPSKEEQAARNAGGRDASITEPPGTPGKPSAGGSPSSEAGTNSSKININTAQEDELMTLNGIGAARARDIIAYREANGVFTKIEDIKNVSGIGDSIFDKIKEQITVS